MHKCVLLLFFSPKLIISTEKCSLESCLQFGSSSATDSFLCMTEQQDTLFFFIHSQNKKTQKCCCDMVGSGNVMKKSMCSQLVRRWNGLVMTSQILACHPSSGPSSHLVYLSRSCVEDSYRGPWLLPPPLIDIRTHIHTLRTFMHTHGFSQWGIFNSHTMKDDYASL